MNVVHLEYILYFDRKLNRHMDQIYEVIEIDCLKRIFVIFHTTFQLMVSDTSYSILFKPAIDVWVTGMSWRTFAYGCISGVFTNGVVCTWSSWARVQAAVSIGIARVASWTLKKVISKLKRPWFYNIQASILVWSILQLMTSIPYKLQFYHWKNIQHLYHKDQLSKVLLHNHVFDQMDRQHNLDII